jgi:hypothetical protein
MCGTEFYAKPSHIKLGWGKCCSVTCRNKSQLNGQKIKCYICKKVFYRSLAQLSHSKSGKYFCSKQCQTQWRNSLYIGDKSKNWKNGIRCYRNILLKEKINSVCILCGNSDKRILSVHHLDHDRNNNLVSNLTWVCQNCHYLVHKYKEYDTKVKNMVTVAQLV